MLRALLILGCLSVGSVARATDLTVLNASKDTLSHLFLSPANTNQWGVDQLDSDTDDVTMEPGESFTFKGLVNGAYDVKFSKYEEDDAGCILRKVQLNADAKVEITAELLASCPK